MQDGSGDLVLVLAANQTLGDGSMTLSAAVVADLRDYLRRADAVLDAPEYTPEVQNQRAGVLNQLAGYLAGTLGDPS